MAYPDNDPRRQWPKAAYRKTAGDGMPQPAKVTQPHGHPGLWGPQPDIGYIGGPATATRHLANADGVAPRGGPSGIGKQKRVMAGWSGRRDNEAPKAVDPNAS